MESTQEYLDAVQENYSHQNIIMPQKMEIDASAQQVIDKFYEYQENGICHVDKKKIQVIRFFYRRKFLRR